MSENDDELELQALQRELDDAFETTRPRPGFEDELWLRVQSSRPAPSRLRDALRGLFQGIREVPAVPMAAVAAALVLAVGVGLLAYVSGGHGSGGSTALSTNRQAEAGSQFYAGSFGRVPTPVFDAGSKSSAPLAQTGPAQLTWTGKLNLAITSAPVFRYREPSKDAADQFATALGAVLRDRPSGFLGSYSASDYTLKVRGTVQSPPSSPAYFIFSSLSMPALDAAGAGPADLASIFLAQHSLTPQWAYTVSVDSSGDPVKVHYQRQFDTPGYGPASLVDVKGQRYGLEVDLSGSRPVLASGLLPVDLESAEYKIVSGDDAVRAALASSGSGAAAPASAAPAIQLTQAELVYVLVPAGDHSFYEPAFLFSGTFNSGGQTLTKRVLVPAVDPSQRTP